MWAFDQASRLRLASSELCMTATAIGTAEKLFAGQRLAVHGPDASDSNLVLQPCGDDVRQTFSMLSQSGPSPSPGAYRYWLTESASEAWAGSLGYEH